jgi:hypothetical protein
LQVGHPGKIAPIGFELKTLNHGRVFYPQITSPSLRAFAPTLTTTGFPWAAYSLALPRFCRNHKP